MFKAAGRALHLFEAELLTDRKFDSAWGGGVAPGVGGLLVLAPPQTEKTEQAQTNQGKGRRLRN